MCFIPKLATVVAQNSFYVLLFFQVECAYCTPFLISSNILYLNKRGYSSSYSYDMLRMCWRLCNIHVHISYSWGQFNTSDGLLSQCFLTQRKQVFSFFNYYLLIIKLSKKCKESNFMSFHLWMALMIIMSFDKLFPLTHVSFYQADLLQGSSKGGCVPEKRLQFVLVCVFLKNSTQQISFMRWDIQQDINMLLFSLWL